MNDQLYTLLEVTRLPIGGWAKFLRTTGIPADLHRAGAHGERDSSFRNVLVAILLVLVSPLFTPIGEALYRVLARDRHRLAADSHCVR